MNLYQQLCQQHQQFQHKQLGYKALLLAEMECVAQQLAERLGLVGKTYRDLATNQNELYVAIRNVQMATDDNDFPQAYFDLSVVLEDDPQSYPKRPMAFRLAVSFMQRDRLHFVFTKAQPEVKLVVNLIDDDATKYRLLVDSYIQLLMNRLSS